MLLRILGQEQAGVWDACPNTGLSRSQATPASQTRPTFDETSLSRKRRRHGCRSRSGWRGAQGTHTGGGEGLADAGPPGSLVGRPADANQSLRALSGCCRKVIDEIVRLKEAGEPIPEHLLPPPKEEKEEKKKGDSKSGGKKSK